MCVCVCVCVCLCVCVCVCVVVVVVAVVGLVVAAFFLSLAPVGRVAFSPLLDKLTGHCLCCYSESV